MENKVVYEVKLSKPVMRLATVLAVGLFANAAVFTFDFVKPAHASDGYMLSVLYDLQRAVNLLGERVDETYWSTSVINQALEDVEADLHHSIKLYCKR